MPRTISDQEYDWLQQKRQNADLAESIFNDPALSNDAKALIKKKHPNMPIADYDLRQEWRSELAQFRKERDDAENDKKLKERDADVRRLRDECQKKYGATDEAMKDLEEFMKKEFIGNYDVAATYRFAHNPATSEPTFSDGLWNHMKQPGAEEIAKDPEGWARTEILKAFHADAQRARGGR